MLGRPITLVLLMISLSPGAKAFAQQPGYLVIGGIDNGPAAVRLNEEVRDSLSKNELTIELAAGRYWLEIERPGFTPFRDSVTVPASDVVHVRPRLERYRPQVLQGSERPGRPPASPGPTASRLRVVHLEPVEALVLFSNEEVGKTPLTLAMPYGEHLLAVGNSLLCLHLEAGDSARVVVRAGRTEILEGAHACPVTLEKLAGEPILTPFETSPTILNLREVQDSLRRLRPRDHKQAGGEALVHVLIAADGTVARTHLYRSSGFPALDAVALRVAAAARFEPGTRAGLSAPGWATLPVNFTAGW
jgi:TonB family protein